MLRPYMIHGQGNNGNLNLLFNLVKRGIPYPLGAFENRRSFYSIENLSFEKRCRMSPELLFVLLIPRLLSLLDKF